jgi:hypothetical protein
MARYLAALIGGGAGEHGSILKPETLAMMLAPRYQPDPRIPGMASGSSGPTWVGIRPSSTRV